MTSNEKLIAALGAVDMDKLQSEADKRKDAIEYALGVLENAVLTEWEGDFYYDVNLRFTKGLQLTEKQYETLMKISYKYE